MLRQSRAMGLAVATVMLVVALAALFAGLGNCRPDAGTAASRGTAAPRAGPENAMPQGATQGGSRTTGRAAFRRLGCPACHAIAGEGNPANPLDDVGSRLDRAALRDWMLGTGAAADELPARIVKLKGRNARDAELDAVLDYLQGLAQNPDGSQAP